MRRWFSVLFLVFAPGSIACAEKPKTPVERGERSFVRLCSGCHGADGRGVRRPGLKVPPKDLTDPALHERLGEGGLRRTLRDGKGQMPAFGNLLPEQEIDELIAYLKTLPNPASR